MEKLPHVHVGRIYFIRKAFGEVNSLIESSQISSSKSGVHIDIDSITGLLEMQATHSIARHSLSICDAQHCFPGRLQRVF